MNKRKQCAEETLKRVSVNIGLMCTVSVTRGNWKNNKDLDDFSRIGKNLEPGWQSTLPRFILQFYFCMKHDHFSLLRVHHLPRILFKKKSMACCCLKGTLPTQYITQKNALLSQIDTFTHTFMGLLVMYKLGIESSDKSVSPIYIYIFDPGYSFTSTNCLNSVFWHLPGKKKKE